MPARARAGGSRCCTACSATTAPTPCRDGASDAGGARSVPAQRARRERQGRARARPRLTGSGGHAGAPLAGVDPGVGREDSRVGAGGPSAGKAPAAPKEAGRRDGEQRGSARSSDLPRATASRTAPGEQRGRWRTWPPRRGGRSPTRMLNLGRFQHVIAWFGRVLGRGILGAGQPRATSSPTRTPREFTIAGTASPSGTRGSRPSASRASVTPAGGTARARAVAHLQRQPAPVRQPEREHALGADLRHRAELGAHQPRVDAPAYATSSGCARIAAAQRSPAGRARR